jgi:putative ABC transport system permease protein
MPALNQLASLCWLGLATLGSRLASALVIVVGIAGVVGVLVALLAMGAGFEATLVATGASDQAIVLRGGANAELSSSIDRDDVTVISAGPGIARDERGRPIVSAEVVVVVNIPKKATGTDANVVIRGVGPGVYALRPNVRITSGRAFTPGRHELLVGRGAAGQFAGLATGGTITLNQEPWTVVGTFESGDAHESEIWADAEAVQSTYRRNAFQSVTVRLERPELITPLKAALTTDPRLHVDVTPTLEYYATQSERLRKLIDFLATTVAVIMAIGATFGALNTMYAAVAARAREVAMLRAIGFASGPIVVSVMLEAMLLALLGGAIGAGLAWAIFDRYTVSTLGANFSQVVFAFQVSPRLVARALVLALLIGLAGGLLPALRAARAPLPEALRSL